MQFTGLGMIRFVTASAHRFTSLADCTDVV